IFLLTLNSYAFEQCLAPESILGDELEKVQESLGPKLWNACAQELYYHEKLPVETRGNYWHDIGGVKYFAKQCWSLDNFGEKEIIYSFLSDSGFKVMKFPVYHYKEKG